MKFFLYSIREEEGILIKTIANRANGEIEEIVTDLAKNLLFVKEDSYKMQEGGVKNTLKKASPTIRDLVLQGTKKPFFKKALKNVERIKESIFI